MRYLWCLEREGASVFSLLCLLLRYPFLHFTPVTPLAKLGRETLYCSRQCHGPSAPMDLMCWCLYTNYKAFRVVWIPSSKPYPTPNTINTYKQVPNKSSPPLSVLEAACQPLPNQPSYSANPYSLYPNSLE